MTCRASQRWIGRLIPTLLLFASTMAWSQISLTAIGAPNTTDFTGFTAAGFTPTPAAGQLDSDTFSLTGMSDGDLAFGGTATSGDYARGASSGGVTTGGVYAFDIGGGNVALGFQPGGSDFTPGELIVRVDNNTGGMVDEITVAYVIASLNNTDRSNSFNFSFGTSATGPFTAVAALDFATVQGNQPGAVFVTTPRNTTLTGLGLTDGSSIFLRFLSDDVAGGGSRDEFAIDDLVVTATVVPVELQQFSIE